jgi:hypothetical protein
VAKKKPPPGPGLGVVGEVKPPPPPGDTGGKSAGVDGTAPPPRPDVDPGLGATGKASAAGLADSSQSSSGPSAGAVVLVAGIVLGVWWWKS